MTTQPWLLVITGLPGSGKSTLARALAQQLGWPLFEKDGNKEILFDTLGWSDRAWSKHLSRAAVALLLDAADRVLARGLSVIVESNFDPQRDGDLLRQLVVAHQARALTVVCTVPGDLLVERFLARTRHPGHGDSALAAELLPQLRAGVVTVPEAGGAVLTLDTREPVEVLVARVVTTLAPPLHPGEGVGG